MDGGLACPDADPGGGGTRGHARTERVPDHGAAHGHRLLHALPADPHQWWFRCHEDVAAAATYRTQPYSLRRADRLVLRAHLDSARSGGGDRIHHADLDRHPCRELSRRAHDGVEDFGDRARRGRRHHHRSAGGRRNQFGSIDRARRSRRIRHFDRHDEVPDPHRKHRCHCFLDAGDPVRGRIFPDALCLELAIRLMSGAGLS